MNGLLYLQIGEAKLGLTTRDYYFNAEHQNLRDAYLKYSINIATLLGADPDTANTDMKAVFDLDMQLANVCILL
jgi:predicted metalloendopeptidase